MYQRLQTPALGLGAACAALGAAQTAKPRPVLHLGAGAVEQRGGKYDG